MIVMKFGGTSVESAAAIQRVAAIVNWRLNRQPVVVVSAFGKTTNSLLAIAADAAAGRREHARAGLARLRDYHDSVARPLSEQSSRPEMEAFLEQHFHELAEVVEGLGALGELSRGPPMRS